MSNISIIGSGNMASAIGALTVKGDSAVSVVSQYGEALGGKIIVDITNPFTPDAKGLVTPDGSSAAEEIAKSAPASAHVVKAFNTLFSNVLAAGGRLDVFMAGDDADAKASVSAFITSFGLRPQDTGDLSMAHWLEGAGLVEMGLMTHSLQHTNFFLGVSILS